MSRKFKIKLLVFTLQFLLLTTSLVFIFMNSEPTYTNDNAKKIEINDILAVQTDGYSKDIDLYIVLQVNHFEPNATALLKELSSGPFPRDAYLTYTHKNLLHNVVGKGTFYHKINAFAGFNLMFVTQFLLSLWLVIVTFVILDTLSDVMRELYRN